MQLSPLKSSANNLKVLFGGLTFIETVEELILAPGNKLVKTLVWLVTFKLDVVVKLNFVLTLLSSITSPLDDLPIP